MDLLPRGKIGPRPDRINRDSLFRPPDLDVLKLLPKPRPLTSPVAPSEVGGIVSLIASSYRLYTFLSYDQNRNLCLCWKVDLDEGVRAGFNFKNPHSGRNDRSNACLNLQFRIRDPRSNANALNVLRKFLGFLEELDENPISQVYFKYGELDCELLGETSTTIPDWRLRLIYERVFGARALSGTQYFEIPFRPIHPKTPLNSVIQHQLCN
jgi:hypothetical protein